jgi:selenium metabolism protein YedF
MKIVDCRNMACPAPVVSARKALEEAAGDPVQLLVDAGAPRENVTRFATSRGYLVEEMNLEAGFALTITGAGGGPASFSPMETPGRGTVVFITSDRLGDGPEELGRLLMKNFIITLLDLPEAPDRLLFANSGVHLTTEGSELLEALEALGNLGTEVLSCGVCLDYFKKKELLRSGGVTTMFTIVESLQQAGRVLTP